ncbi:helix-turn-helix transcriptional regulator [Paenibacillus apiarius]|uniref:helix-turn-helix transcriptional regulator n=1 Tax=Paenibacillus apiarius TaxID=46240 RepID=UPI003B3B56DA
MRNRLNQLILAYGGYTRFAADIGKTEKTVRNICCGASTPTMVGAFEIAKKLGVTVDELFNDLYSKV